MVAISALHYLVPVVLLSLSTAFIRFMYILPLSPWRNHCRLKPTARAHMVVVLGSGGHTAEMMSLLRDVDPKKYHRRTYIVSSGDDFSSGKAFEIEKRIQSRQSPSETSKPGVLDPDTGLWEVKIVPRARNIHQPLYTTPWSCFWCLIGCFKALYESSRSPSSQLGYPDVIISNGPATAVIVILASTIMRFFGVAPVWKMKIIYVESWARVKTLSLSGKILFKVGLCDTFIVQWEILAKAVRAGEMGRGNVQYVGFLVE